MITAGYVICGLGVVLMTINLVQVGGALGGVLAVVNIICVVVALLCIHSLRRKN